MSQGPPVAFNWQKFLQAIAENLPAIIALITALIDAIVSSGRKLPAELKSPLAKLYQACNDE